MQLEPYLHFNGTCEEALNFYKGVFGGEIVAIQHWEGSPLESQVPADFKGKVLHATYKAPEFTLMASDSSRPMPKSGEITLSIGLTDEAEAKRIFEGLAAGAEISMPLQQTYWAKAFGSLTDRYGVPWMINCA
jgi:PhnB protein